MIGAVLAGGAGRRLGGDKALATVAGRPLIARPLEVLGAVCDRVVVVSKPWTALGELPAAVDRWHEPGEPRHPLTGIVHALEEAGGPVMVCAADMPFVTAGACRALVAGAAARPEAAAAIAFTDGRTEPLLGVYRPEGLAVLRAAPEDAPLTLTVEQLAPVRVPLPPGVARSVNTPEQLRSAEAELLRSG